MECNAIFVILISFFLLATVVLYVTRRRRIDTFLDGTRKQLTLIDKTYIARDVCRFRFSLPHQRCTLGLPCCKHIVLFAPGPFSGCVKGKWNGREDHEKHHDVSRKYTPVTCDHDTMGYMDIVVKIYRRRSHTTGAGEVEFPDGGKVSQYLDSLSVGSNVVVNGPVGLQQYIGNGVFRSGHRLIKGKKIGLIAGGTGITPMLQIIATILDNREEDSTDVTVSLLYANHSEEDIILRERLEIYEKLYKGRFNLWYTLTSPPRTWPYSTGHVNTEMIRVHIPAPGEDTVVLCCGPPPMMELVCKPGLAELGHASSRVIFL